MESRRIAGLQTWTIPAKKAEEKLVVTLHGLGDSSAGYTWLPQEMRQDHFSYLLVDAPDPYFTGYSWFDLFQNPSPGVLRSRKLLTDLLAELETEGWASTDIFLFGFSQGALMSMETAIRYPHKLAGIIAICGFLFSIDEMPGVFSSVAKEQKFLVTHGQQDPVVPIDLTRPQIQRLQSMGLAIDWQEYPKVHTIDLGAEMQKIREFMTAK